MKLRWTEEASQDLIRLAEHSPRRVSAVVSAMEWMARVGFSLGRPIAGQQYWPVPPLGVFYRLDGDVLNVTAVVDTRQRRDPW